MNTDGPLPRWPGRAVQAWLLDIIRHADPPLAESIHQSGSGSNRRPYTISVISAAAEKENDSYPVESGSDEGYYQNKYILRITSVSADLTAVLAEILSPQTLTSREIRLNGINIQISPTPADENRWSGQSSFEKLAGQTLIPVNPLTEPVSPLECDFASP